MLIDKFRLKNRPCIAYYSEDELTGSNSFYFGSVADESLNKVLAAWFNSTPFLALFLFFKREISGDWSRMKITDLDPYPCLDPARLSGDVVKDIARAIDSFKGIELPKIPAQLGKQPRTRLDSAIIKALDIDDPLVFADNLYRAVKNELATTSFVSSLSCFMKHKKQVPTVPTSFRHTRRFTH